MEIKFPNKGLHSWVIKSRTRALVTEVESWRLDDSLGALHCKPHPISEYMWKKLLRLNPNNLGNWSTRELKVYGTQRIERDLIFSLVDLLGGKSDWEGYVTSGATESNIYSVWVGRNFLRRKIPNKRICIIVNDLSHYSLLKAADICGIDPIKASLNRERWVFDIKAVLSTIKNAKKKYEGFLIPLTLGYTQTGTNDDYEEIVRELENLENEIGIKTFAFIDAALNGLVLPFTRKDFRPLKNERIQSFCLDFHKAGMTPLPCGVILYRRRLRPFIEKTNSYLKENDSTLLGSRSGIPAVAAWSVIMQLGRSGFKEVINHSIDRKLSFIFELRKNFPKVEIADDGDGLSLGLVNEQPLSKSFIDKYGLYAKEASFTFTSGKENLYIYKVAFLPLNW